MRISDWSSDVCSSDLEGVFFPEGGMQAVPVGLAAALEQSGAEPRYGVEVDRIVLAEGTSGRVRGVHVAAADGTVELLEADRSAERRVGEACVRTCRSRRSADDLTKNSHQIKAS